MASNIIVESIISNKSCKPVADDACDPALNSYRFVALRLTQMCFTRAGCRDGLWVTPSRCVKELTRAPSVLRIQQQIAVDKLRQQYNSKGGQVPRFPE